MAAMPVAIAGDAAVAAAGSEPPPPMMSPARMGVAATDTSGEVVGAPPPAGEVAQAAEMGDAGTGEAVRADDGLEACGVEGMTMAAPAEGLLTPAAAAAVEAVVGPAGLSGWKEEMLEAPAGGETATGIGAVVVGGGQTEAAVGAGGTGMARVGSGRAITRRMVAVRAAMMGVLAKWRRADSLEGNGKGQRRARGTPEQQRGEMR